MNTIHNFSASLIQRTKQAGRYSTSGIYTSTVNSFFRFVGHRSITFAELTPSLIKQYEDRLLGEGRRHNTISTYMRMLRSISHQAAEQGIPFTHSIDDLFAYVFTGYEPTAKRAISPLLIRRLVNLDLEKKPALRFRHVSVKFLLTRHSVRRPCTSPQNGCQAQYHLLLPS